MDVAINGKFLGAPNNGVHRTAKHFSEALLAMPELFSSVRVYAPRKALKLPIEQRMDARVLDALGSGQLWENVVLPAATRRHLLVNFCNLAPVLHPRYVVMIHDAQTYLYPEDYSGKQAAAYRRWMPVIGNRAKLVLTVSEFARKSIAANGIAPAEKIRVVYNGTDHILQTQSDLTVLSRIGVTPGRYLLAVGSTKGYKNMRVLFDALQMAPSEFPLVVAGGGNQQDFTNAGLIIPPHVRFTGRVTDQELRGLYENASVFLFPSRTEGFGLPPLEAMQCGCPVVSARAGAMPEVCGDGAILVSPDEPAEWVEAIRAATTDTKRQELLARGRQRAQLFTWEKAARMLQDALTEVALEPARAKVAQPAA
jgi:glycosyltransferase involved in cell wall biosynthesis